MFDVSVLSSIRALNIQVGKGSDSTIIRDINAQIPDGDFLQLAMDLDDVAKNYDFKWSTASWNVSDGREDGTLLYMEYQATIDGEPLLLARRLSDKGGELRAYHELLGLPTRLQRLNISRAINSALLIQYKNLAVSTVELNAGLDAGGYVWAKAGFSATERGDVDKTLLTAAENHIVDPLVIEALKGEVERHYFKNPNDPFPIWRWANRASLKDMLLASNWHGVLNLRNKQELSRFEEYLIPKP
jgi:hypothetical protein